MYIYMKVNRSVEFVACKAARVGIMIDNTTLMNPGNGLFDTIHARDRSSNSKEKEKKSSTGEGVLERGDQKDKMQPYTIMQTRSNTASQNSK